ncbi:scaffold/adaptor protein [Lithospermum erythrorhizon]|uniref:Scaffold/adaptor protein n=1 Tax=Lithospermum erythrorhizon TaxID=34254 RepID=A0AAV3NSC1_LITER
MEDETPERRSTGCGLFGTIFRGKNTWPRRSTSTGSIPHTNPNNLPRHTSTPDFKQEQGDSFEDAQNRHQGGHASHIDRIIARPGKRHVKSPPAYKQHQQTPPIYNQYSPKAVRGQPAQGYAQGKRVPYGSTGISGELESMFEDYRGSKGAGKMVRASSGNVMLHGNLGNLRQPGATQANSYDYQSRNAKEGQQSTTSNNGKYSNTTGVMGNVVKSQNNQPEKPPSLCRALSTRMDPEQLKILGNEDYKNGNFEEALALYDAAISIDPNKASYRSNKSAALTALGRLLDAVLECREAIRIEPFYQRAHNRLAILNLRLGDPEKTKYHFKHAGAEAEPEILHKAKNVQIHLNKCTEAKRQRNWNTLVKECELAISAGADSAPLIFALKAEALLRLNKHEDADVTMRHGPNFEVHDCTKYFGPIGNAALLVIRAQVNMVIGRFDDAVTTAQLAARLDANNKEVNMVVRRTKAVASARSKGNELFKEGRYSEACIAYGEGLNHDPHNSILLCNRAACRTKLGQYEQALKDCNAALNVRPNFSKARLRRADCCTQMKIWETCIQDCEALLKENPNDEEVSKMLNEAKTQMKRRRETRVIQNTRSTGDWNDDKARDVVMVSDSKSFRDFTESHEISVVLFSNKQDDKSITLFLEQLSSRYPSVKFLKVEVEDCPELEESEGVDSLPSFKLYKNGSRTKEISGNDHDLLESTIKSYTS